MAWARVDGMKYLLLLLRPCCLVRSHCRERFALGAARARPPGHLQSIVGGLSPKKANCGNLSVSSVLLT